MAARIFRSADSLGIDSWSQWSHSAFARVRSGSVDSRNALQIGTLSERVRTFALTCHAEGRGFESLHPLQQKAPLDGLSVASCVASTRPASPFVPIRAQSSARSKASAAAARAGRDASQPGRRPAASCSRSSTLRRREVRAARDVERPVLVGPMRSRLPRAPRRFQP